MRSHHLLILAMAISLACLSNAYAQQPAQSVPAPALPSLPVNPIDTTPQAQPHAAAPTSGGSTQGAPVSTDPAKFSEAQEEAEKIKMNPLTQKYLKEVFYPTLSSRYSSVLKECFAQPKASKDPFTIVLALDKEGHVEAINLNTTTTTSDCMMKSLTLETFGLPPFVPFHIKVKMKFNQ